MDKANAEARAERDPTRQAHARGPFRLDECGDLSLLRRALEAAGYTGASVTETVRTDAWGRELNVAAVLRRTAQETPFNALVRLFVLARVVPEAAARAALAPARLEQLNALGLLEHTREGVRAVAALFPFAGLLLARDFWSVVTGQPDSPDHVTGVGHSSLAVANLTVRRPDETALDLGTGSGFLALLAARHAKRVIASDTNSRALSFAALNARLNEATNIELRQGSLYEPVSDCAFDLIVSNPPYVISPRPEYEYRDGGMAGDVISERVVRGAPPLLREGGFATLLLNWHHQSENDWAARPSQWVANSGCDAWLIRSDTTDPLRYASSWLRQEHRDDPERRERLLDEWLAYYYDLGIGWISWGAVILRRRSNRRNWLRVEGRVAGHASGSCSDQIQRIFAAQDLLEELDDGRLLDRAFALTPHHELTRLLQAHNGRWAIERARLRQTHGFEFAQDVDPLASALLTACDGRHTLRQVTAGLAANPGAGADRIAAACIAAVRKLLRAGFLTLAGQ